MGNKLINLIINYKDITFPVSKKDYNKIELENSVNVNVDTKMDVRIQFVY